MAKIIQLIYTEERVGTGKDDDPKRLKQQLFTFGGELIAEDDLKGQGKNYLCLEKLGYETYEKS